MKLRTITYVSPFMAKLCNAKRVKQGRPRSEMQRPLVRLFGVAQMTFTPEQRKRALGLETEPDADGWRAL